MHSESRSILRVLETGADSVPGLAMMLQGVTIYMVFGWRVDGQMLGNCMMNVPDIVADLGIKLTLPKDQKYGFFGLLLAQQEDQASEVKAELPAAATIRKMKAVVKKMGIGKNIEPSLWAVLG